MNASLVLARAIARTDLFVPALWPGCRLYDKQQQILESVRDNHVTMVHSANQCGKSHIAAVATLWFYLSRTPARVVVTSSSGAQLENVLWAELRRLVMNACIPLGLDIKHARIGRHGDGEESLDRILAHVPDSVENFQGHHLGVGGRPRILFVFDEASAIRDELFEAAQSQADRILCIGNPLVNAGFFHDGCVGGDLRDPSGRGLLRKVIHIDGRDSPNYQAGKLYHDAHGHHIPDAMHPVPGVLSYVDYLRRESEWDEHRVETRLRGRFYSGGDRMLFPPEWLDACAAAHERLTDRPVGRTALGVDVAEGGRDNSVFTVVDEAGVIEQRVMDTPDTMAIPGEINVLMREWSVPAARVYIDRGAGGKQIADLMRERGKAVHAISFGARANDPKAYTNRRAELYGMLREAMRPERWDVPDRCLAIPRAMSDLRRELAVMPHMHDSEGRMKLPPKEASSAHARTQSIRQMLGGASPDRADSLALAVVALVEGLRRGTARVDRSLVLSAPGRSRDVAPDRWW